ncbi:unnamed protein product [Calypogeia fissa]
MAPTLKQLEDELFEMGRRNDLRERSLRRFHRRMLEKLRKSDEQTQIELQRLSDDMKKCAVILARPLIERVAQAYMVCLISKHLPENLKKRPSNLFSSSCDYPLIGIMAKETGQSITETKRLCGRIISSCDIATYRKETVLFEANLCRRYFQKYPVLAAKLPYEHWLLVEAQMLDELF